MTRRLRDWIEWDRKMWESRNVLSHLRWPESLWSPSYNKLYTVISYIFTYSYYLCFPKSHNVLDLPFIVTPSLLTSLIPIKFDCVCVNRDESKNIHISQSVLFFVLTGNELHQEKMWEKTWMNHSDSFIIFYFSSTY